MKISSEITVLEKIEVQILLRFLLELRQDKAKIFKTLANRRIFVYILASLVRPLNLETKWKFLNIEKALQK